MPIDPSISLNVVGGGGPHAPPVPFANPLGIMNQFLDIQQKQNALTAFPTELEAKKAQLQGLQNQILQFQQEFGARQQAGHIIASSPNLDEAQKRLLANPQIAAWGLPVINSMRQIELTNTQIRGETQRQLMAGAESLPKVLIGAAGNPGALPGLIQLWGASQPESIRGQLSGPASALITSIMPDGTMNKPPEEWTAVQRDQYKQNMAALMVPLGVNPATAELAFGRPGTTAVGGVPVPIQTDLATGQQTTVGGPLRPNAQGPGPGANLVPGGADRVAGNGVPLSEGLGVSPNMGTSTLTGEPIPYSAELKGELLKAHAEGARTYNNSQVAIGSLDIMSHDLDVLARASEGKEGAGNFLTPGAMNETRLRFAEFVNAVNTITGSKMTFDPLQIAAGESFIKQTQHYGIQALTTMLGTQREAAETIKNITTKGTPSINNSYLGAKLIIESNKLAAQRLIDEHDFRTMWMADPRNKGNLQGADVAFNNKFPASSYMERALASFGMDKAGKFVSPEAVSSAFNRGLLTQKQAIDILKAQFGAEAR